MQASDRPVRRFAAPGLPASPVKKQAFALSLWILAAAVADGSAIAQTVAPSNGQTSGFYGGVALREAGSNLPSFGIREPSSVWGKYASPTTGDAGSRALLVGGYRWQNDLSVEASFATSDRYTLRPDPLLHRGGVGLTLQAPSDTLNRSYQADVYTSFTFLRSFALYGRLGYAQNDLGSPYSAVGPAATDPRRTREGVNYGLGLRYDVNSALGLRLEYARFGRFAGEAAASGFMPESDQVQLGVQLRF